MSKQKSEMPPRQGQRPDEASQAALMTLAQTQQLSNTKTEIITTEVRDGIREEIR